MSKYIIATVHVVSTYIQLVVQDDVCSAAYPGSSILTKVSTVQLIKKSKTSTYENICYLHFHLDLAIRG